MPHPLVSAADIETYRRDGVVIIRGLFADHVDALREGIARNMDAPGPYASENKRDGETGRLFDDYCNWPRIPEFEQVIIEQGESTMDKRKIWYITEAGMQNIEAAGGSQSGTAAQLGPILRDARLD